MLPWGEWEGPAGGEAALLPPSEGVRLLLFPKLPPSLSTGFGKPGLPGGVRPRGCVPLGAREGEGGGPGSWRSGSQPSGEEVLQLHS